MADIIDDQGDTRVPLAHTGFTSVCNSLQQMAPPEEPTGQ
jgi:hypothetical protein